MLLLTLTATITLMSQFSLPGPKDNALSERIEWDSIIESEMPVMLLAYWKREVI